ncbi:MAG: PKD domain-containing protein [Myxococcaceae bacterium]
MRTHWLAPLALAALVTGCDCGGPPGSNGPPLARIVSPADGAALSGPGPHLLLGEATDAEDGVVAADRVTWSSDRDGTLASGTAASAMLSVGVHRLSLDALDSGGLSARAQVTVTVVQGSTVDQPPAAAIDQPAPGAFFDQGQAITLRGHATDPEDGALTGGALGWTSDKAGVLGSGVQVVFSGAALGTHRIVLTATDRTGHSAYASVDITVVPPGTNRPPAVAIQFPLDGAQLTVGAALSLRGTATDPEDGPLSGAALAWTSSRDGALGTGSPLPASLTQGVHTLTLKATDSLGAFASAQLTVSVNPPNNLPPVVSITAPAAGLTVFQGTPVSFEGTATDPEDGALSGTALSWESSRDGALGTGSPLSAAALTAGDHTVTLVARDSGGSSGTASVLVHVLPQNAAPTASIAAPLNGSSFVAGSSISFSGSASDPEDGALSGASLTWRSSLDGVLGTGASLSTSALSAGAHQVTLTAVDSGGRSGSANVSLTVTPATANIPPIARLTGPSQGQTAQALSFDGSTSSDADGSIVSYRFDFGDGTAPVSGAASGASHTFAAPGSYTVGLTVTDDRGATGAASVQVVVTTAVRLPEVVDSSPENHGGACSLAVVGTTLHVAWYSSRHPTLWYGTWSNGTFTREVVDALGFNVGGEPAPRLSMALDGAGAPRVAYGLGGQVHYAGKSGGGWVRERVDTVAVPLYGSEAISIALDPSAAYRPTVSYSYYVSSTGYARTALATRTGAGAWTLAQPVYPTHLTAYTQRVEGDIAFDGAGRLYLPMYLYGSTGTTGHYLTTWTPTAMAYRSLSSGLTGATSLAWAAPGRLFALSGTGLLDIAIAAPLSASTVSRSYVEVSGTGQHAVATAVGGEPRLVINHGSELESIRPGPGAFWSREGLGATDTGVIDAVVDSAGNTRACFFRAGKLLLY